MCNSYTLIFSILQGMDIVSEIVLFVKEYDDNDDKKMDEFEKRFPKTDFSDRARADMEIFGVAGGYNRAAYGYPKIGENVLIYLGENCYINSKVNKCGFFTFGVEERDDDETITTVI